MTNHLLSPTLVKNWMTLEHVGFFLRKYRSVLNHIRATLLKLSESLMCSRLVSQSVDEFGSFTAFSSGPTGGENCISTVRRMNFRL